MTTLTIQIPDNEKEFILKLLKKVNAKVVDNGESPYNQDFVKEVKASIAEKNAGNQVLKVNIDNLWK